MKIVNIKRAAVAAVSLAALLAALRLQRRRRPPTDRHDGGGGGGGDSGYTFAMITHETPGDTFWDRIRAGAEQAAKDTGSTLKYSSDPEATKQAHPDPGRHRRQGRRHRDHAGDPGRSDPDGEEGRRRRYPGRLLQLRHRLLPAGRLDCPLRLR